MKRNVFLALVLMGCMGLSTVAQARQATSPAPAPVARVKAISFPPGKTVSFKMMTMSPMMCSGEATVTTKSGTTEIEASFKDLGDASSFGPEYLVYVLWAVTPDGKIANLGPLTLDGKKGDIRATTHFQAFALGVTAEPYYAVTIPSDTIVMANALPDKKSIQTAPVEVKADLLERGRYKDAGLQPIKFDPKVPLELYEARNAVEIARWQKADKYASDTFAKAVAALEKAEAAQKNKKSKAGTVVMAAREAVQAAEDARGAAVKRAKEEQIAAEQKAAADRIAAQKEAAAEQLAAEQKAAADRIAAQKEAAAEQLAAQKKASAEQLAAEQKAAAEREAATQAQAQAQVASAQAEAKAAAVEAAKAQEIAAASQRRMALLKALNQILTTKDTDRGLVATLPDVTFDTGSATLKPAARESLAKVAGVVATHPDLKLDIEGYTDNVGSDETNQALSEKRAEAVRDYIADQGIPAERLTAKGLASASPVADNDTPAGRAKNRRVEIVISGGEIGTVSGG